MSLRNYWTIICIFACCTGLFSQEGDKFVTPFEKDQNYSATYQECISYYQKLAKAFPALNFTSFGMTDAGYPLHVGIVSSSRSFDPAQIRKDGKVILMINNAIHPGEPDGVDATMMLVRDLLSNKDIGKLLEKTVVVFIPFYNIDGGLLRSPFTRADQNGPVERGQRGNAKNLDLNRDFIKCDSKNAASFSQIFTLWNPDVLIDNHVSNGADYQHVMTLLTTQHQKLGGKLGEFLKLEMQPALYQAMRGRQWDMVPYVNVHGTQVTEIPGFLDQPRYCTGYAALRECVGFTPETHMLKPYPQRVTSTYDFMFCMLGYLHDNGQKLIAARNETIKNVRSGDTFVLNWAEDRNMSDLVKFKGYEMLSKPSEVSGLPRNYFDREKPFESKIPHYTYFSPTITVTKPHAYIIPQAYSEVIERLKWNGVQLVPLKKDTFLTLEMVYINNYKTTSYPYESHYMHSEVEVERRLMTQRFFKGDMIAYTDQDAVRFIIETLEPQAPDSYFNWNFFDGILMQKEGFSSYAFEDRAAALLKQNPELAAQLESKKKEDPKFAASAYEQLNFIYQNSYYQELRYNQYPVGIWRQKEMIE